MPKKNKKCRLIVLNIFCNFLIFKLILLSTSTALASTINTQQQHHHEIQQLRSELNKALEYANQEAGAVVQLSWTLKAGEIQREDKAKVQVTPQNRQAATALRAEIGQAVAQDRYATQGVTKTKDILGYTSLGVKNQGQQMLKALTGSAQTEQVDPKSRDQQATENPKPNIIYANAAEDMEIDIRKLQSLVLNKRRTHEILVLNSIEEDFSFDLGSGVEEWKHIVDKGQEYFIGRREMDVLIVSKDGEKYKEAIKLDIGHHINCLETYSYWNLAEQQQEAVILIAAEDKVLWYRANHTSQQMDLYWLWQIGRNVTELTYFSVNSQDYLIIISEPQIALNIYQFQMSNKEFWLAQHLQMTSPNNEVCVLNTGRDVILAIPQNNTAAIYTFNHHESAFNHLHFEFKRAIPAQGILTVAGFKMAGHSYLALSGYQPQILLYQQGDFISKTILGSNFGLVELFLPLPVSSYRDDLLLLVQHRVDFNTHTLTVVEILLWDGDTFGTSIPVPCHIGQHKLYGASCILDLHREAGLKGAYQIQNRGRDVSLIVPRYKAESGLFRFHTELLPKNSELLDLQDIFDFLKEWVKEQDDLVAQAEAFLQMPDEVLLNLQADFSALETLSTPEFTFSGEVAEIYVNDYNWTQADSNLELDWVIQNLEDLHSFVNKGRHRRNLLNDQVLYHESLEIDSVTVDEFEVATVNGLPFYIQNGDLYFEGGQVEFEELEKNFQDMKDVLKRETNAEDFVVEGDMEFEIINGIKWADLKDNLVFRTQKQNFEELEVEGEIIVETELNIKTLNTLDFPGDYLLSSGPSFSIVKAEKHFINTLRASSVDTDGLINGKNPLDAINLMDNQTWQGMPTFRQLEVTEVLELHGQAQGPKIDSLPFNPTLQESRTIEASCHFNELYVNGLVLLQGELDNALGIKLKDIVLKPAKPLEQIIIPAPKTFDMVLWPRNFELENNTINHIPVQDFVTVHAKQTLQIRSLEGYVFFYNLTLKGSYDGVRIEDMLKEIILLDKPVDLSHTELIFPGDLKASSLNIIEALNGQKIKNNIQTLQEDLVVKSVEFDSLQALQADFLNDILGPGKLNNKELHDFVLPKPWHKPAIQGNVFLNELILAKGLQTDELHGIKTEFLYEFLNQIDELPDMVLNGLIHVDHIYVTGDVQLNKLNKQNFDEELQLTTIWLNRPNYLANELMFKQRLLIKGPLNVMANYRGMYLPDVIDDMVLKSPNSSTIELQGPKSFLKPVNVLQNTQAKALNGMLLKNVALRSTKENYFKGSVQIKGNLWARHLKIQGKINFFQWHDIENLLYFDGQLQKFVLKDTVEFNQTLFLDDLTVHGNLNDIHDLTDFFEHLIYKNNLHLLKGKNTFTGRVSIERGAYIKHLNGHDLMQLFNNLVFIHGYEPVVIRAPVIFEDTVEANEVQVKKTMELKFLNECSLREWLNNTLRVDRDHYIEDHIQFAAGSLDGNSLEVHFINNVDLKRILTLHTPQTFNETVKFSEIHLQGFIDTKGLVNKVDLESEYNNTLMVNGSQHISTPLNIQTVVVLNDLIVKGPVNSNKNLQDVVTLHEEDIILESPVYFQSLYSPRVITKDLVTGIDFENWFAQAVINQDVKPQYINGNWSVKNLKVREGANEFEYVINGYKPEQYYASIRSARSEDKASIQNNKEMCQLLKEIRNKVLNTTLQVKYIEEVYDLKFKPDLENLNGTIRYVDLLKSPGGAVLLLINLDCDSLIFHWQPELNKFVYRNSFSSGPIDHIEIMPAADNNNSQLEFVTTFSGTEEAFNCSTLKPVDIWSVVNNGTIISTRSTTIDQAAQIYISSNDNSSLWSLNNETLKEYDLATFKTKQSWQLPRKRNATGYRLINLNKNGKLLLSNGVDIVLLEKYLMNITYDHQPVAKHAPLFEILGDSNSKSILKPNATLTRDFVFDDSKQHVERILSNLRQRLSQQVNISQLSIPETDLLDVHFLPDFLLLMQELHQQNILPAELFNKSFLDLQLPENPAQVLAVRVIQITWSAVKEIEEIHSYLSGNTGHNHPLCARIIETVAYLITDLLKMAHQAKQDHAEVLNKVIERLHEFEIELQKIVKALETNQATKDQETLVMSPWAETILLENDMFLPGYKQGEIINLQVGHTSPFLNLWAVTNRKTSTGVYIYEQGFQKYLFQIVNAVKPRSLQQLRLKQETFLMFIEDCCQVNILQYKGSEGFLKYAKIKSKDSVKHIKLIDLPSNSHGSKKYFLILVLEKQLKFYEFVLENGNWEPVLSKLLVVLTSCV